VLGDLGVQVVDVDVTGRRGGDDDHAHAGHDGARGVGAVGARRDEADVALGSPLASWKPRIASSPANSPWLPAFGCRLTRRSR
jgi:hypothetical protein